MVVIGTRPEAIKLVPVVVELERHRAHFETQVCVTGQHRGMLDQMLQVFGLRPDHDLGVMKAGQGLAEVSAACLTGLDWVLRHERPDLVLVQGTRRTLPPRLRYYNHIPVGHIEAGLLLPAPALCSRSTQALGVRPRGVAKPATQDCWPIFAAIPRCGY
jgi:UDP-N-acetylglucosamine 2-epimerase (non-hydrolysing)